MPVSMTGPTIAGGKFSSLSGKWLGFLCLVIALFFLYSRFIAGDGKGWKSMISSDGIGYYAYLPSFIIYGDPRWEKFTASERKIYGRPDYNPQYLTAINGHQLNKYFSGEAILLLPFFLTALFLSWITGADVNGLSFFFQLFTGLGSIFYLFAGLYYLRKITVNFGFSETAIAVSLTAAVAGTNLFYYSLMQPAMSHTFSFFSINAFLWSSICLAKTPSCQARIMTGIMLALIILLRPVNLLLVLVIPLFLNGAASSAFIKNILSLKRPGFIISFVSILLLQPVLWYLQTGHWLIMSYPDEGFYFLRPRICDFLLSFRRGWFIYTPLMMPAMAGILYMPGKKLRNICIFMLFISVLIYVSSSWWCWYYGDGFGQRPLVDFYGVFIILLAALLSRIQTKPKRIILFIFICSCIFLNLFQTWQYRKRIISSDNMNRDKFAYVFLRTADEYRDCLGGASEEPFYRADLRQPLVSLSNGFELPQPRWFGQESWITADNAAEGKAVFLFTPVREFGPGIELRFDSFSLESTMLFCNISLMIRDSIPGASNLAMMVINVDSLNLGYNFYNAFRLNDIPVQISGTWRPARYCLNLPKIINPSARIKIYLWNPGHGTFMVDEMRILLFGREKAKSVRRSRNEHAIEIRDWCE